MKGVLQRLMGFKYMYYLYIYLNAHSVSKLNDAMTDEISAWHVTEKPVLNGIEFLAGSESSFFRCGRADIDVPDTLDADVICFPLSLSPNLALPGGCHQCKLEQPVFFFFVRFLHLMLPLSQSSP